MTYSTMNVRNILGRSAVALGLALLPLATHAQVIVVTTVSSGDLIKSIDDSNPETTADTAVYYVGADNKRYVFPNEKTYFAWYSDFSTVKTVSPETMASFPLGGNATYRPGLKMIKIQTDPKTYAVSRNGILRWVKTEAVAQALYGSNWNQMIDDVSDAFFVDYRVGAEINAAAEYSKDLMRDSTPTINSDKLMEDPSGLLIDIRNVGFVPSIKSVTSGQKPTWINLTSNLARVASDPHPTHGGLAGFESGDLGLGAEYGFTFTQTGSWGYHNHWTPAQTGTVIVQ